METLDLEKYSIRTGTVRRHGLGYLLGAETELETEEEPHTALFQWDPTDDRWAEPAANLYWTAHSACIVNHPREQLLTIGSEGDFLVFGQGEAFEGSVFGAAGIDRKPGELLRGVHSVLGKGHVVGSGGAAYRRDGRDQWSQINDGLSEEARLEAVDGFDEEELYAVGWEGQIWRYNGRTWSRAESPTNSILTNVHCAPDGNVYCVGRGGVVLRGRNESWAVVAEDETDQDFWDVQWFDGKIYLSTASFLYTLTADTLERVEIEDDPPESCYHLSSADGVLWSIGGTDVVSFDGTTWSRIV